MATKEKAQGITIPKANPGTTWKWVIDFLVAILGPVMAALTPMLRDELEKLALKFYKHAESTSNPWDDFLAEFLLRIMGIPIPSGNG